MVCTCVSGRLAGVLCIVKLSWHHSVVGQLLIHRSDPLTWPHATISVTLGALLLSLLVRRIRETHLVGICTCVSGRLAGV